MADYEQYMDEARRIVSASKAYGVGNNAESLKSFATNYRKDPGTYDETANVLSFMRDTYGSKANKLDAAGMSNVFKQYRYYQDRSKAGKEPLTIADANWDPTTHDDDYNTVLAGWYRSNKAMPESWQESEFNSQLNAYRSQVAAEQKKQAEQAAKEAAQLRAQNYEAKGYAYASGEDRTQAPGSYAVTQRIIDEANDFNAKAAQLQRNGGTANDVRKLYAGYRTLNLLDQIEAGRNLTQSTSLSQLENLLTGGAAAQSDAYNRAELQRLGILSSDGKGATGLLDTLLKQGLTKAINTNTQGLMDLLPKPKADAGTVTAQTTQQTPAPAGAYGYTDIIGRDANGKTTYTQVPNGPDGKPIQQQAQPEPQQSNGGQSGGILGLLGSLFAGGVTRLPSALSPEEQARRDITGVGLSFNPTVVETPGTRLSQQAINLPRVLVENAVNAENQLARGEKPTYNPDITGVDLMAQVGKGGSVTPSSITGVGAMGTWVTRPQDIIFTNAQGEPGKALQGGYADIALDPTTYIGGEQVAKLGNILGIGKTGEAAKVVDQLADTTLHVDPEDLIPTRAERLAVGEDPLAALRTTAPEPTLPRADMDTLPVSPDMPRPRTVYLNSIEDYNTDFNNLYSKHGQLNPYTEGTVPVNTESARSSIPSMDDQLYQDVLNDWRNLNRSQLQHKYQAPLQAAFPGGKPKKVTVRNVTFDGNPYIVDVNKNVVEKALGMAPSPENIAVMNGIDDVIADARYMTSANNADAAKTGVIRYDYFQGKAMVNHQPHLVSMQVEVRRGTNNFRSHQVTKIEISPIASARGTNGTNLIGTGSGDISEPIISRNVDVMQEPNEDPLAALRRDVPEPTLPNASAEALYTPEQRAAVATSKTTAGTGGKAAVSRGNIRNSILELADNGKLDPNQRATNPATQQMADTYVARERLQNQLDYMADKYNLTAEDKNTIDLINKGKLRWDQVESGFDDIAPALKEERLSHLREYQAKLQQLDAARAEIDQYKAQVHATRFGRADDLLANSDAATDKNKLALGRETMERNSVDVFGEAEGGRINREVFEPVHTNEAMRQNFLNQGRQMVKDLKLTPEESRLVQQVGEGKVRLDELPTGANAQKIQDAVSTLRKWYDDTLIQVNAVLVENGYAPVPKRGNYFPHFMEKDTLLDKLRTAFGLDLQNMELPTDINGLTQSFKPGKQWFGNFLHREGNATTFDAVRGFDRYIEGVSNVIYHTDDIQRLRALEDALRTKYSRPENQSRITDILRNADPDYQDALLEAEYKRLGEPTHLSNYVANLNDYTNVLAGKQSAMDRGVEAMLGRDVYSLAKWLTNRVAKNMVAVNPGSWLAQYVPLTQGLAPIRTGNTLRALRDTVQNVVKDDGFRGVSTFLTNRSGSQKVVKTTLESATDVLTKPMRAVDDFTSELITRARYYDNLQSGLTVEAAMADADNYAAKVIADRSKGSQPTLFNAKNPIAQLFMQFQLEVNNQLSFLFKDLPRDLRSKGVGAWTSTIGKLAIYGYLFNEITSMVTGRRIAIDPIGGALGIYEGTTGDRQSWAHPEDWIRGTKDIQATMERDDQGNLDTAANLKATLVEAGKDLMNNVPFAAAPAGALGLEDVGRLPISASIPNFTNMNNPQNVAKELSKPLAYWVPPVGGGQIKKSVESGLMLHSGGEYATDANGEQRLKFPAPDQPFDMAQAVLFGKYATPQGRGYVERGFQGLGAADTKRYQTLTSAGLPREGTFDALLGINTVKAQKDTTWQQAQKVAEYVNGLEGLTAAQKQQLIQEALVGGSPNETTQKRTAALQSAGMSDSRIRAVLSGVAQITPANGKTVEVGDIRKWLQQQRVMGFMNEADFEAAYRVLGSSGGTAPTSGN